MKNARPSILFTDASQPVEGMNILLGLLSKAARPDDDREADEGGLVYPRYPRNGGGPSGAPAFAGMTYDIPPAFMPQLPVYSIAC